MIFLVFFFGILGTVLSADDNILCTSDFCKDVTCSNLPEKCQIQNSTHNGIFLPSPSACNCCDYCIENLNEGEECSAGDITDPSPSTICGPGLYCKPTEGTDGICSRMISNCFKTQDDYDKRRENGTLGSMEVRQDCDSEGEFVPYKCIPGQTCYCNNSTGSRIFGESDYTSLPATDLHCKCSRDYEEAVALIGRQLRPDEFFHCAPNGDYEVVQCMNEQCFCVDAIDGAPTYPDEPPVNLTDLSKETLKCYTKKEEGIFYQKCETEYLKILKEYKKYKNDGYRMVLGYDFPLCDVDGTYQAVQENDTHKFCVDKEGAILNTIDKKANATLANNMNCKCARARLVTTSNEPPTCDDNGNYSVKQTRRGRVRCVDMNGNQVCNKKNCEVDEGQSLTCPTQK